MTDRNEKSDHFDVFRQLNEISRQNLSYLTGTLPPFTAALAKWNLEMLRFSAQRALEYRELSARMAQCRTPVEVWAEQKRFFDHMQTEYAEELGRLLDLMNGISHGQPRGGDTAAPRPSADAQEPSPGAFWAGAAMQQSAEAMSAAAETAREMAGAATAAAAQVAADARSAMQQVDESAPGAPQARAAIDAAEAAANTIARQAEATAALFAGGAAVLGATSAADALGDTSGEGEDAEDEDADMAASVIAEMSPPDTSDESDDDVGASALDDESQTAEAMLSEPVFDEDEDAGENDPMALSETIADAEEETADEIAETAETVALDPAPEPHPQPDEGSSGQDEASGPSEDQTR